MKALTYWLTGLSGAGKSTLASALAARLEASQRPVLSLDGDVMRQSLCSDLGFSPSDRAENVRRIASVAKLANAQGFSVICALISPLQQHRNVARQIVGEPFCEVFVHCPIEECIRRDPKGLYARAMAGKIPEFTGIDSPYEVPESPEITLCTHQRSLINCVDELVAFSPSPLPS